jgi:putative ATP-dependent endonuclease of the OLD family
MPIEELYIDGFRCLCDFRIRFENDITLIVGENDSGKSSIIDCINLFTGSYHLEKDDFNYDKNTIKVILKKSEFEFIKEYKKDAISNDNLKIKPINAYLQKTKSFLESLNDPISEQDKTKVISIAKLFGLVVRSNSIILNLKESILTKLNSGTEIIIEAGHFPEINLIQLNGKQFENIESFFGEVFIKDKQMEIWNEKISDGKTIKEFIDQKLVDYSANISQDLESKGIKTKIKTYLKNLTEIKITPSFQPRNLNINSEVKFLENGKEINVDKKGDGTKRRISLALLEYKAEKEECEGSKLYILDEPDTHLHVKAQLELLQILKDLKGKGCQIILTTHSPFLINATKPKQIRLLFQEEQNNTKLRYLKEDPEIADRILRQLGIENIYLYFARKIVLVEGETEESFLPRIYEKINDVSLNNDLIKVINSKGIPNIPGFAKALLELVDPSRVYVVRDNDAHEDTVRLIEKLNIPEDRQFIIGTNEFEDAFTDEVLFASWAEYLASAGKNITGSSWTLDNIRRIRAECRENTAKKFSDELRTLNTGLGKKLTKPIFGQVLGNYCSAENIPEEMKGLLQKLKQI